MAKDGRDLSGTSPEILGAAWFDPIEAMIRDRVRGFIENLVEAELDGAIGRSRYQRAGATNVAKRNSRLSAWASSTPIAWFVRCSDDQRAARTRCSLT